ncbi:hypothetical protein KP509_20G062500 [Ceratopteris richardii]|uniref:non-specific serine/threonine protein kinase n=1 Tax=Ceratopteris richardii TaxID=49495 RepID=A0A8T2SFR8_CERRI|nr:hypothetical protein KP509_20G062500 [Ceratopteris richardii]
MSRTPTTAQFHQKSKTLNGKYLVGDEIGKGAYGKVYKGLDSENGDFVAIKQVSLENIPPEDLASIMQEIDLLKNLNHKNIVKYLDSFKTKSHLHIILEYVENGSLASIIKPNKFGAFPESLVAKYIAQVLEGLVYLHEQGVIHRDIKGANILTTKEGLVKLADFGVATKLTEADANTDSVVGTPYWMAPEVIVLSGVSAASDIWSMGCTVIELLTCIPPYYDLPPMSALYRIVEEEHPPIPEDISPLLADFLLQCFRKDAKLRPDAKTLLQHPWIQSSRRVSYTSVARSHEELMTPNADIIEVTEKKMDNASGVSAGLPSKVVGSGTSQDESFKMFAPLKAAIQISENVSNDNPLNMRDTSIQISRCLTNGENGHLIIVPDEASPALEKSNAANEHDSTPNMLCEMEAVKLKVPLLTGTVKSNASSNNQPGPFSSEDIAKSAKISDQELLTFTAVPLAGELSKFSDTPADGILDDLFHNSFSRSTIQAPASDVSDFSSRPPPLSLPNNPTAGLAAMLKAKIALRNGTGEAITKRNDNMVSSVSGEVENHVRDLMTTRTQSLEISRLVGLLKPEESEEFIIRSCQRLASILQENPEQKSELIPQHSAMAFMDMLEVKNNRVILAVLQVINLLAKDNPSFQENACLVGLIPLIMSFANPKYSKEMRIQAAIFIGQLCQTSSSTLQMFIACRGLPILVGFLEPDYAKYREMVHISIDAMWQVFNLQCSTPRNDFCIIFSKNGVLIRLVNTLHSLNEATRFASPLGTNCAEVTGQSSSGLVEPSHALSGQIDGVHPRSGRLDGSHVGQGHSMSDYLRASSSAPSKCNVAQPERKHSNEASIPFPNLFEQVANDGGWSSAYVQERPLLFRVDREKFDLGPPELFHFDGDQMRSQFSNGCNSKQLLDQHWQSFDTAHHHQSCQTEPAPSQREPIRPLISLLEKNQTSRPVSGQLEYIRHLQGLDRRESILPLLQHASATRKNNGELDLLMSAFDDSGKEMSVELSQSNLGMRNSSKRMNHMHGGLYEAAPPTSGFISQSASGFLSVSGVLNGRSGSNTSSGMLSRMVSTLNADVAREYLEKVADLLLEFARGDTTVKTYMCGVSLLIRLFQMLSKLEASILLKTLRCIKELSSDPCTLEHLQRADAIKHLVPFLEWREGPMVLQIHSEVLNALYNLCKINKRRQERAAESGVIPHLMYFVRVNSTLKRFALPLLCDMAHASRITREQLKDNKGIELYLSLLEDENWAVTALDSLAACLAFDNEQKKVEQALLKPEAIQKLIVFFQSSQEQFLIHILEPFLKMIIKSSRINVSLATSGLFPLLVARLDHQDAIVRLTLLKLIKAVYEHHPRPKQLIVEYDLQSKLQMLVEERRDDQVLVKQMAISLLKALHINCVL